MNIKKFKRVRKLFSGSSIWCGCFFVFLTLVGCEKSTVLQPESASSVPLFTLLSEAQTGITFQNTLTEGLNTNILVYEYLYNGGGVAAGDVNGDGLTDLYFSANMTPNALYINKGAMKFEEVTAISGVAGRPGPWKTGVTLADVNGDNKLDLYVCYSGALPPQKRINQLFINQGNNAEGIPVFTEQAKAYGLDSPAFSNQAYFFDYDRDGDLDALLLNHNPQSYPVLNVAGTARLLKEENPFMGVRLYQQRNGFFKDVTLQAGISSSPLTYGLGLGISDLNNDGWPDVYVSNDYAVPDYLYMNNGNGTFIDVLKESMGHTSHFSMGNDIADINNDGLQDIITLDMLPKDNYRQKLLMAPDNYDKFDLNVRSGFHYQYMRNMLQLNNGNGTFSEIGQLAGISNTDWSWAALTADYDNDGWKDLYVTNGYYRDYTNLDFINYMDDYIKTKGQLKRSELPEIIAKMPSSDLVNYLFMNKKGISFTNATASAGVNIPSNSNGAAYADLDNDGDLDLIINNINQPVFIYQNTTLENTSQHYLQVKLQGEAKNTQGLGTKVTLFCNGVQQTVEQSPARGYLSSVSPVLHFGLGAVDNIDTLVVTWNSGKQQQLTNIKADQMLVLREQNAKTVSKVPRLKPEPIFRAIPSPVDHNNPVSKINDFKRQSLLICQLSHTGPCMVKGDVNNDGLDDVFIGGARGQSAALFLQNDTMHFVKHRCPSKPIKIVKIQLL